MHWGKATIWSVILLSFLAMGSFFFFIGIVSYERDGVSQAYLRDLFGDFDGLVLEHGLQSQTFLDAAYDQAAEHDSVKVQAIISPHHLLVAKDIAALFEAVSRSSVDTVVIISPNHFGLGTAPAHIGAVGYSTPYGQVDPDQFGIQKLLEASDILVEDAAAFNGEHGIAGLTPFVKRSFPGADIVPIMLHESLSQEDAQALGELIAEVIPNALVVASIDFSHNLPSYVQEAHDDLIERTLENGEYCAGCAPLEIDSNATLATVMRFAQARGDGRWNELTHTDSLSLVGGDDWGENVSHYTGYFSPGEVEPEDFAALHFVGDIMLDRGVRVLIDQAESFEYPWEDMQRFLMGAHLRIGNLEGTVNEQASTYTYNPPFRFVFSSESVEIMGGYIDVVSLANNHTSDVGSASQAETKERLDDMEIDWFGSYATPEPRFDTTVNGIDLTFIGYHQFQPDEDALVELISSAHEEDRFVIVQPHWGTEYEYSPSTSQEYLAEIMVNAGADLIIGGHPHVVQGIQLIDDVPVVYSLGNFIFDQQIPVTWQALTVHVIVEAEAMTLRLLPIEARDGQPTPVSDAMAQDIRDLIAQYSDAFLQDSIKTGVIEIQYEQGSE
jgi:AmmeMemoRadiSam system protein B